MEERSTSEQAENISLWQRLKRLTRYNFLRILRQKSSAHSIALGVALGVLVGFMPIIPFQTITVLTLAFIFRGNKIAAAICTCFSNPLNLIPFYYMLFVVGKFFFPFDNIMFDPNLLTLEQILDQGYEIAMVMFAGGFLLGIPATVLSYFAALKFILTYRKRRAQRMLLRRKQDTTQW